MSKAKLGFVARASTLVLVVFSGCAGTLSSFQPAHVAPRGHVSAEAGFDVALPASTVGGALDTAKTLASAARTRMLTEDEKIRVLGAGLDLALNPPLFVQHLGVAYVPVEHWEVGLRYTPGSWRLATRRQLVRQEDAGYDFTLGLGLQRSGFGFPIGDVIDVVHLDSFTRWNLDVPMQFGRRTNVYRVWGGPRFVWSHLGSELRLHTPGGSPAMVSEDVASASGSSAYIGVQGGAALGYRAIFIAAELTVARMYGSAQLDVFGREVSTNTDTWVVYPGVALMTEW